MKLVVGCPVADRDWILPAWFAALQAQTRQPDEYVFVLSERQPTPVADTIRLIRWLSPVDVPALSYALDDSPYIPRYERNLHDPEHVYGEFARRRNLLRRMVLKREPDIFLSLDSDILLDDPRTIERLVGMLDLYPVAAPLVWLHPTGHASECYNAAWWAAGDPGSPDRAWRRATHADAEKGPQLVDIPMAAVMMRGVVLEACSWYYHRQGEDLGFAQDLEQHGMQCAWDPSLTTLHVMDPREMPDDTAAIQAAVALGGHVR